MAKVMCIPMLEYAHYNTRVCRQCKVRKSLIDFPYVERNKTHFATVCKACKGVSENAY